MSQPFATFEIVNSKREDDVIKNGGENKVFLWLGDKYKNFIKNMRTCISLNDIFLVNMKENSFLITVESFWHLYNVLRFFNDREGTKKYKTYLDLFPDSKVFIYDPFIGINVSVKEWDNSICWLTFNDVKSMKDCFQKGEQYIQDLWDENFPDNLSVLIYLANAILKVAPIFKDAPDDELILITESD